MISSILVALGNIQIARSERPVFAMNSQEWENWEISRHVFDEAISLAKASGATLTLLHVISQQEMAEGIQEFKSKEKFEQECRRRLKLLEDEAACKDVEVNNPDQILSDTISGEEAGRIICDHARRWKNDLIVVGRREQPFYRPEPGSVSKYVIQNAPCTTFVVHSLVSINPKGAQPAGVR